MKIVISQQRLILIVAILLAVFYNTTFYSKLFEVYGVIGKNFFFVASTFILLVGLTATLLTIVSSKYTTKPILIIIILLSSLASYFMDSYGTIIDKSMLSNMFQTDVNEAFDLFSLRLLMYFLFLGVIPAFVVYKLKITHQSFFRELRKKVVFLVVTVAIITALMFTFSASYASFIREHKSIRYYTNPLTYIHAVVQSVADATTSEGPKTFQLVGEDAVITATDTERELIIMVVGETARADRFSLNGYERKTNPLLEKEEIISFDNFYSCGTSTAISVPCMFSFLGQDDFTKAKAGSTEDVLDVLKHAGVSILWRDNNSSSKGVADRVTYQDFRSSDMNPDCDLECRDVGMLTGLQTYIDSIKTGDILIVLHQMGNHGPAYYKRYPKAFEVFTPTCQSNQLESCSVQEINNSYDNAIVYTDYFLDKVISLLKANSPAFEAAMFYMSDHGESLGEKGLYLHGLPYALAPTEQKHVAALMWFDKDMDINPTPIKEKRHQRFSHDNVPHTLLGFMEVESDAYQQNLDILSVKNKE